MASSITLIPNAKAPKVQEVEVQNDSVHEVKAPLMKQNFAALVVGAPGPGKTTLMLSAIKDWYSGCFHRIYFFSQSAHTLPPAFTNCLNRGAFTLHMKVQSCRRLRQAITEARRIEEKKVLFVLDDCVSLFTHWPAHTLLNELVWNRRHIAGGASVIITSQKLRGAIPLDVRTGIDSVFFFNFNKEMETAGLYADFATGMTKAEYKMLIDWFIKRAKVNPKHGHQFLFMDLKTSKNYADFEELVHV